MRTEQIKSKLINAVTDYDRKQSNRKGYNPYALGRYMMAVDEVCVDMEAGVTARDAVNSAFNDRLADICLKAIGEPANE